jgi:F-type H+-transporting ATPase subunit gamma
MLANVAQAAAESHADEEVDLLAKRPERHIQFLVVTADRGLAGAFNSNVIRLALKFIQDHADADVQLELIGRKGRDFFRKRNADITGEHVGLAAKVIYNDLAAIAQRAMELYRQDEIDAVYLLYNEFKSVATQKVALNRVLPLEVPQQTAPVDYIYEQPPVELLSALIPKYVELEFYRALLESAAAEHAARMTAMDAATSNAGEMIEKLTLYMNRVRQASITKEIIEVVSGAAAAE